MIDATKKKIDDMQLKKEDLENLKKEMFCAYEEEFSKVKDGTGATTKL